MSGLLETAKIVINLHVFIYMLHLFELKCEKYIVLYNIATSLINLL